MASNIIIKKVISFIKSELNGFYPASEISSFIFLIFEYILGYSRTKLLISYDEEISEKSYQKILNILADLKSFKPIQYILGSTTFYDLTFKVASGVLIPRPETEELVNWIINENSNKQHQILDIGTGSGCIAISLAKNLPNSKIYAADISSQALHIAEQNSRLNDVNIETIKLDILNYPDTMEENFNIIVSNPPYVTEKEKQLMQKNVLEFEPELALFVPNTDPLRFYKKIAEFGIIYLNPKGKIYFEINEVYGSETAQMMEQKGYTNISIRKDINGKDRMLRGILK